jgi:hypothetical protein
MNRILGTLALGVMVCGIAGCDLGMQGPRGEDGPAGPVGPVGPKGENGADGRASVVGDERLVPEYFLADTGARAPTGAFFDTELDPTYQTTCRFLVHSDGVERCLPGKKAPGTTIVFTDDTCTHAVGVLTIPGLCGAPPIPPYVLVSCTQNGPECAGVRVYKSGPETLTPEPPFALDQSGGCKQLGGVPGQAFDLGTELDPDMFVAGVRGGVEQ